VWRLYRQYARPLARIVRGVPISWDSTIATKACSRPVWRTAWSPCSRFIAIEQWFNSMTAIRILDAVTLKQLKTFIPSQGTTRLLAFSPESRLLTWGSDKPEVFISWDLQTGGRASAILLEWGKTTEGWVKATEEWVKATER